MVLLCSSFSPAGVPELQCSLTHNCVLKYQLESLKYFYYITIFKWFSMSGAVSCIQTLSENNLSISVTSYIAYWNFVKCRVQYLPNLKNRSYFSLHLCAVVIAFKWCSANQKLQSNVSILELGVLVYYMFALCNLYFFPCLISWHCFNTILIKSHCMCKTKIMDKGQRTLPFADSVPKTLQYSLQILIASQLSVLKRCLFINNKNVFSCVPL